MSKKQFNLPAVLHIMWTKEQRFTILLCFVSLFFSLISGFFLFALWNEQAISGIIQAGFDDQRAQLTSALLLAASAAFIGAAFTKRKFGAIVGAVLPFGLRYLGPFIQHEQQPVFDPGGHLEPLNSAALMHTACVIVALGLLSAFIGSAVGSAIAEVLLEPPFILVKNMYNTVLKRRSSHPRAAWIPPRMLVPLDALHARSLVIGLLSLHWWRSSS